MQHELLCGKSGEKTENVEDLTSINQNLTEQFAGVYAEETCKKTL